jgi:hypothetical protein
MRFAHPILMMTLVLAIAFPVHAGPPAPSSTRMKQSTPVGAPRVTRSPIGQAAPRMPTPRGGFGGPKAAPAAAFKPQANGSKPAVRPFTPVPQALMPAQRTFAPPAAYGPTVTTILPRGATLKKPLTPLQPQGVRIAPPVARFDPPSNPSRPRTAAEGPRYRLKDGRPDATVTNGAVDVSPGRFDVADSDRDGVPDWREQLDDLVIVGNGANGDGANGNGANGNGAAAEPGPAVVDAGPTAWDWVAIGLAAAAFADGIADRRTGGSGGGRGIVVERPIVQAVPAEPPVVVAEPIGPARSVVIEEIVTTAEGALVAETRLDTTQTGVSVGEPVAENDPLPKVWAGEGFELPARGLGGTPGKVAMKIGVVILECPVTAWTDEGLRATVPPTTIASATRADLIVALADGSVAAVVPVELLPGRARGTAAVR